MRALKVKSMKKQLYTFKRIKKGRKEKHLIASFSIPSYVGDTESNFYVTQKHFEKKVQSKPEILKIKLQKAHELNCAHMCNVDACLAHFKSIIHIRELMAFMLFLYSTLKIQISII